VKPQDVPLGVALRVGVPDPAGTRLRRRRRAEAWQARQSISSENRDDHVRLREQVARPSRAATRMSGYGSSLPSRRTA